MILYTDVYSNYVTITIMHIAYYTSSGAVRSGDDLMTVNKDTYI